MEVFASCHNLHTFYLRRNAIKNLLELAHLRVCMKQTYCSNALVAPLIPTLDNDLTPNPTLHNQQNLTKLEVLWLEDNEVTAHPFYRQIVLALLPQLTRLDNKGGVGCCLQLLPWHSLSYD